ncbi:MAG: glycosyltransferase family 2 protein [Bacteroidota bacterium]
MQYAPIILFAYNRPLHTQRVLDALAGNKEAKDSTLYIYCDGAKATCNLEVQESIRKTRIIAKNEKRFKELIIKEQTNNKGLAKSIIDGVSEVIIKHGKAIIVEDDILVSEYFLKFMNDSLTVYNDSDNVACINSYVYPVKNKLPDTFFIKGADCWGWATWQRAWNVFEPDGKKLLNEIESKKLKKEFDFEGSYPYFNMLKGQVEGRNNSWAIRWYASAFLRNMYCLYPGISMAENIGIDGSGENSGSSNEMNVRLSDRSIEVHLITVSESEQAKQSFIKYFWSLTFYHPTLLTRIKKGAKMFLRKIKQ